jgi:hypothetical protein
MSEGLLAQQGTRWAPDRNVHVGWWTALTPTDEGTARLVERTTAKEGACRCGRPFSPGDRVLEVARLPPEVREFLEGRVFCSRGCVRGAFLEVLSSIDRLDTPASEQIVEDLEAVFAKLALALGQAFSPQK